MVHSDADHVAVTDTVDSRLHVTNVSATAGVDCSASAGQSVSCSKLHLAAGGSFTITVTYEVASTVDAAASVSNTGSVASDEDSANDTDTVAITEDVQLSIDKEFADASVIAGTSGHTFTLVVSNGGASDADHVAVTDTVDSRLHVTNVSATAGVDCSASAGQSVSCSTLHLAAGGSFTITVTYEVASTVDAAASVSNTGSVASDEDSANDTDTVAITRQADLSIVKTDGTTTVAAGTSTTYTITLTNNGPSSVGAGVVVKDNIPANTTPSETEPNCSISGGVMTCTTTTSLLPGQSVTYSLTLFVPITYRDGGNTTLSNTAYIHSSPETDPDPTDNSSTDTDTVGAATVGSGSTMTDSAFQLKDDLGPWTITDFEILLNNRNVVVATNPGQFYYHQRATNPFSVATKWEFNLNWPKEFTAQMEGGNPIHAYVQLVGDPANTWRDWTPQSTGSCWTYSSPADNVNPNNLPNCGGQYGKITVNNVPAGAKVWVTVHLDFALKGTTQPQSITLPKTYGPFRSDITIKHQQTGLILGTSTSQTNLLGRGKKVTVVYGTTVNGAGNPVGGVWMKVQQGTGPSVFIRSDVTSGEYVIYDGQACGDGLTECSSAWTFANGTNVNTTITIYGNAVGGRSATPMYPTGYTRVCSTGATCNPTALNPPGATFGVTKGSAYNRDWKFAA